MGRPEGDAAASDASLLAQPWWPRVRGQILRHPCVSEREAADRDAFLADAPLVALGAVGAHHLTASVLVVAGDSVLLHTHRRTGELLPVGGHVELGESPWQAARREAREEAGIDVDVPVGAPPDLLFVGTTRPGHRHYDITFVAEAEPIELHPGAGESTDVGWCTIDDIAAGRTGVTAELRLVAASLRPDGRTRRAR